MTSVTEDTQDEFESIKNYNADLLADAWQLPDLRRENAELKAIIKELERRLSEMAIEVAIMRLLMLLKTGGKRRRNQNERDIV